MDDLLGDDNNGGEAGVMSWYIDAVTERSVSFTGRLDVPVEDLSFSQVTVYYSDSINFNINDARKVSTTTFDADCKFTIVVTDLKPNVKYNYCLVAEVKSEKICGDVKTFTTAFLYEQTLNAATAITYREAVISGKISLSYEKFGDLWCGIEYSTSEDFTSDVMKQNVVEIDSENNFSIKITSLTPSTTYYYRLFIIRTNGVTVNGDPMSFKTLPHPYECSSDLDVSSATDLSSSASANCYIVSESGLYKFKTVQGNSMAAVCGVVSPSILWETYGTSEEPECLDLIKAFCYKDGYIAFQTADAFREGNAVIAAKDVDGNILWSWHIWFTDLPKGQIYFNNAGTVMDRNLGATSATPGDAGALGLFYQWGRKDPFLGSSSISSGITAKSTINWPLPVSSDSYIGTIDYTVANPTTVIAYNSKNYDWYYTGSESADNPRWSTSDKTKSIYDPCPAGWRVLEGDGVWCKALGWSLNFDDFYDNSNEGLNFSGKFGSYQTIWYPASGYLDELGGLWVVGEAGYYWSTTSFSNFMHCMGFNYSGVIDPLSYSYLACGMSVRCLQE
ncbi:MAG: hypothetical protein IKT59_08305 [Bacteroidales bacterium]|nr:hypothetical protein [Bacteroidales bacterium]